MIVRDGHDVWLLISQVEHARVAAEFAAAWRLPEPFQPLAGEFQFAVRHHDDGWYEWEQAPTVDAGGNPRDFMDMQMPVATEIWCDSINATVQHSRWSGLWVSRHFCHLAELAVEHRQAESDRSAARQFLAMQSFGQKHWRASLGVEANSSTELFGLRGVQFFDRLSLWLCCAERTQPQEFDDPFVGSTKWTPQPGGGFQIECGSFIPDELRLSVAAVAVPKQSYADDSEVRAAFAAGERKTLSWRFVPSAAQ